MKCVIESQNGFKDLFFFFVCKFVKYDTILMLMFICLRWICVIIERNASPQMMKRFVYINDDSSQDCYCDNRISNRKYTLLNFIPKNLWEQFRFALFLELQFNSKLLIYVTVRLAIIVVSIYFSRRYDVVGFYLVYLINFRWSIIDIKHSGFRRF